MIMLITNVKKTTNKKPKNTKNNKTKTTDASSPTTAGRSPLKTASTAGCFWYFRKNLLMVSIRIKEGSTTANVAMTDPQTLPVAVKPT